MDNLAYLCSAYSIVWGALFSFLFLLYKRQEELKSSVDKLKKRSGV